MALRDSWHSALVYFGLAEERHHDEEWDDGAYEAEEEIQSRYEGASERSPAAPAQRRDRRHLRRGGCSTNRSGPAAARGGSATALRSIGRSNGDVKVHLVIPKSFNDAQQVADKFKDGRFP